MARNLINCPFCTSFILKHEPGYLVDCASKALLIKNEKFFVSSSLFVAEKKLHGNNGLKGM